MVSDGATFVTDGTLRFFGPSQSRSEQLEMLPLPFGSIFFLLGV